MLRVIKKEGDGLIRGSHTSMGGQHTDLWVRCVARKHAICDISNREIKPGDAVYRPMTNGQNRMYRALAQVIDERHPDPSLLFEYWYEQLNEEAIKAGVSVADKDAWRDPFDRDLAPLEALQEEYLELASTPTA